MKELSVPAKAALHAAATLMIGFATLAACRGGELKSASKTLARGDVGLAYSAMTYITWSRDALTPDNSPFVIAIVGKLSDAHEKQLSTYTGGDKKIHGRQVKVLRIDNCEEIGACHVLFVSNDATARQSEAALKSVGGRGVLTIGETGDFVRSGGVLALVPAGDEWMLELNPRAAKRQQLKVDVRLVNVSVLIESDRLP
jgi:hypothetical protein